MLGEHASRLYVKKSGVDDLVHVSEWIGAVVALVCGLHAVVTRRVMFGEDGDDLQVWLYGWRAVAIGCVALIVAALLVASATGLVGLNWE